MNLLMISGDRSILQGKKGAFWHTLEEFHKNWERIDVICPHAESEGTIIAHGNVHFHPSPKGLWYQPWWILNKGKELVAEHDHAVMTVHEYPPFYNGVGAGWLSKKVGIPYALEIHHIVGFPHPASFSEWLGKIISRLYLSWDAKRAAKVRTVNASVKEQLAKWGIPEEKIHVVPSFYLDHSALQPQREVVHEYDVVFCARLVANKGLGEVIDAIHMIPNVTLLVVGDGLERTEYEKQMKVLGLEDRVTFRGWVSDQKELFRTLQMGRVFVMNSRSEGGPRVALEAMGLGMPVIATRVGVMPEVIEDGENGLFTTGEPPDLAQKIRQLLDDSTLRESLGREARKVLDRFEKTSLIQAYAEFLKGLVS